MNEKQMINLMLNDPELVFEKGITKEEKVEVIHVFENREYVASIFYDTRYMHTMIGAPTN